MTVRIIACANCKKPHKEHELKEGTFGYLRCPDCHAKDVQRFMKAWNSE